MAQFTLAKVGIETVDRNFFDIKKTIGDACPVIRGVVTGDTLLATGENRIRLPGRVKSPVGRIVVYQTAAASIVDVGQDGDYWVVDSSAPTTVRMLFF
jgi:hypothetical protein